MRRLVEDYQDKIGPQISSYYYNIETDHENYNKILNAIDTGGGQTCDVANVVIALHKAGFKIVELS